MSSVMVFISFHSSSFCYLMALIWNYRMASKWQNAQELWSYNLNHNHITGKYFAIETYNRISSVCILLTFSNRTLMSISFEGHRWSLLRGCQTRQNPTPRRYQSWRILRLNIACQVSESQALALSADPWKASQYGMGLTPQPRSSEALTAGLTPKRWTAAPRVPANVGFSHGYITSLISNRFHFWKSVSFECEVQHR